MHTNLLLWSTFYVFSTVPHTLHSFNLFSFPAESDFNLLISYSNGNFSHVNGIPGIDDLVKDDPYLVVQSSLSGIAVDYRRRQVFVKDSMHGIIEVFNSTIINNSVLVLFHPGLAKQHAEITVDWVAGNVYWVDSSKNWIMMQKSSTDWRDDLYLPIINSDLDYPCSITVDPIQR